MFSVKPTLSVSGGTDGNTVVTRSVLCFFYIYIFLEFILGESL